MFVGADEIEDTLGKGLLNPASNSAANSASVPNSDPTNMTPKDED
jgi:hypothetical protein